MKRRLFLFASAAIVAAPSLMKLSTAALGAPAELVMPDQGPIAMTIGGVDHVYDEAQQAWVPAPVGTPHWRSFLIANPPWPALLERPQIHPRFIRFRPSGAASADDFERRLARLRDDDYRRLGAA